jgi:hypothetical protein
MVDSDEDRKKTIKWWEPLVPLGLVMASSWIEQYLGIKVHSYSLLH